MHHHFAIIRHRITQFAPKHSAKITVYQSMQNLCQWINYSVKIGRNWIHIIGDATPTRRIIQILKLQVANSQSVVNVSGERKRVRINHEPATPAI